jgi:hypothetical protein
VRALDKNLTIVSEAERAALYGLPDFDDFQRAEYFALTAEERTLVQSRAGLSAQISCILQIGYFKAKQAFFKFRLKGGLQYYTATMSFEQEQVHRYSTRLVFLRDRPEWLRIYECDDSGSVRLVKDLHPSRENQELSEYTDVAEDVAAKSARIYVFRRAEAIPIASRAKTHRAA